MIPSSAFGLIKRGNDLARITIADNEFGARCCLHGDMRASGGDDLAVAKAQTALRQVVSAPLQGGDQFVETAAEFTRMGQAVKLSAPVGGLLNVSAVGVHLDRQCGQVEGLPARKHIADDISARSGVVGIAQKISLP